MKVEIFNVEHGGCVLITTDANQHVLIDCGHRVDEDYSSDVFGSSSALASIGFGEPQNSLGPSSALAAVLGLAAPQPNPFAPPRGLLSALGISAGTGWRPSEELTRRGVKVIDRLVVSNYDSDHLSDFHNILGKIHVAEVWVNPSITMPILRAIKQKTGGIGTGGLAAFVGMMENLSHTFSPVPVQGIYMTYFWVPYHPQGKVQGTNNLSVVTFLSCSDLHMIFPGDVESPGWEVLLQNNSFLAHLKSVNIFVASHHGRLPGYHPEVFANGRCEPVLAVISDKSIVHGTQENAASRYGRHVRGMSINARQRSVLTTRDDGDITFEVLPGHGPTVRTSK